MLYGVIDIGSNTIRCAAYKAEENKIVKTEDKLVKSHILDSIVNNSLSKSGLERLIAVLNKLYGVLLASGCDSIRCFATSALRGLENTSDIQKYVFETTGIDIDILSGEDEAKCDFAALRNNIAERSAIGIDLGGGSCQLLQFEHNKLLDSKSFDIGSRRMQKMFVSGNLPTAEERKKIAFYVRNELAGTFNLFGSRYIYAIGGTAKNALKLQRRLSNSVRGDGFLSNEKIDKLFRIIDSSPDKMYEIFTNIIKSRADTIIPGMTVLRTICDFLDVEGFYVLQCSVREGYLAKILDNDNFVKY